MHRIWIVILELLSTGPTLVFCWHAFMGQEAVPTLPKGNLDSSLKLPNTDYFATDVSPDNCSIALTSLRKLANGKSCSVGQSTCSIQVINPHMTSIFIYANISMCEYSVCYSMGVISKRFPRRFSLRKHFDMYANFE